MGKANRKAGATDRMWAEIIGGRLGNELRERGRIKDRKQDKKKGAQMQRLRDKRKDNAND